MIFEAEGGSDKGFNGQRKDTPPLIEAIRKKGWNCELIFYRDEWNTEIFDYVVQNFDGYISRINPGNLVKGEKKYFQLLTKLYDNGLVAMSHPTEMLNLGSKDVLFKLSKTGLVPNDIFKYTSINEFKHYFPKTLAFGERVLKQNRGSSGIGIWRVSIVREYQENQQSEIPLSIQIKCTEAKDNQVKYYSLGHFMNLCEKYLVGKNGLLIDMPYLPRIREGEFRILLVGNLPIQIIRKKPSEISEAFSANLFSGAVYINNTIEEHPYLMKIFKVFINNIKSITDNHNLPLLWTADFILSYDDLGNDIYFLSEINSSCVGFTKQIELGIQDNIAEEAISRIIQSFLVKT